MHRCGQDLHVIIVSLSCLRAVADPWFYLVRRGLGVLEISAYNFFSYWRQISVFVLNYIIPTWVIQKYFVHWNYEKKIFAISLYTKNGSVSLLLSTSRNGCHWWSRRLTSARAVMRRLCYTKCKLPKNLGVLQPPPQPPPCLLPCIVRAWELVRRLWQVLRAAGLLRWQLRHRY